MLLIDTFNPLYCTSGAPQPDGPPQTPPHSPWTWYHFALLILNKEPQSSVPAWHLETYDSNHREGWGQEGSIGSTTASFESLVLYVVWPHSRRRRVTSKRKQCPFFSVYFISNDGETHKLGPLLFSTSCRIRKCQPSLPLPISSSPPPPPSPSSSSLTFTEYLLYYTSAIL